MRPVVWARGFGHCVVLSQMDFFVGCLQPTPERLEYRAYFHQVKPLNDFLESEKDRETLAAAHAVLLVPMDVRELAKVWVGLGWRIVRWKANVDSCGKIYHPSNTVPSCVSVVKAALGISAWVFTPKQLFNWLLRHGGEEIILGDNGNGQTKSTRHFKAGSGVEETAG